MTAVSLVTSDLLRSCPPKLQGCPAATDPSDHCATLAAECNQLRWKATTAAAIAAAAAAGIAAAGTKAATSGWSCRTAKSASIASSSSFASFTSSAGSAEVSGLGTASVSQRAFLRGLLDP